VLKIVIYFIFKYSLSYSHTLFKNMQQTYMNKMQMTITKEKNYNIHKKLQHEKAPVNE